MDPGGSTTWVRRFRVPLDLVLTAAASGSSLSSSSLSPDPSQWSIASVSKAIRDGIALFNSVELAIPGSPQDLDLKSRVIFFLYSSASSCDMASSKNEGFKDRFLRRERKNYCHGEDRAGGDEDEQVR